MKNIKTIIEKIRGNDFYLVLFYAWVCLIISVIVTIVRY